MEVQDEGAPSVRVIYVSSSNDIQVQEAPIYIIPDEIREDEHDYGEMETVRFSPAPSTISDASTELLDEDSNHSVSSLKPTENKETEEQPSKKRPHSDEENDDEDDGRLCPICFDNWTNAGAHRFVVFYTRNRCLLNL